MFLDLSAAFDTTDYDILLSSLEFSFHISSATLSWIRSHFSERRLFAMVQDIDHNAPTVPPLDVGVPQGSVLRPVLLVLYTTPPSCSTEKLSVSHEMNVRC